MGSQAGDMANPAPANAIDLNSGMISVGAGVERTVCMTGQMPITSPIDVTEISTRQQLTHHVIFYKYLQGGVPQVNPVPTDCQPLDLFNGGQLKAPLFIGESADPSENVLKMPPNVVYHMEPTDYYAIEIHIINASLNPINLSVDVYLTPATPNSSVQYADMLFFNNTKGLDKSYDGIGVGLPPMANTTIDPSYGAVNPKLNVFGLTTHQHHLGTGISVYKASGPSDPGTLLFTNTDWQHPALYRLPDDAPLTFPDGGGLRWICSYDNTTTSYVEFGQSALTNEMCITWGYYYPSIGFQVVWN
jgi:hypothetical protein